MMTDALSRPAALIGAALARCQNAGRHAMASPRTAARAAGMCGCALSLTLMAGCDANPPTGAQVAGLHSHGLVLARGGNSALAHANPELAQTLNDLRRLTARYHDLDRAQEAGYALFASTNTSPPLTSPDGCISDRNLGGMGYHYTPGDNLADNAVSLLDPEFLVYAPKKGPRKNGEARRRLAGFDYFIPYSDVWPGPDDPDFDTGPGAPSTADFATLQDLPPTEFAPSRFNGWMFHIWLWYHNPDGMFANWNSAVPLCENSAF